MKKENSVLSKIGSKKFIPGIAWFFLVMVVICLPGNDIPPINDWFNKIYIDKWAHVGLFSVLAFLFMRPFLQSSLEIKEKWHYMIKIALATAIWGLNTEIIQKYFVPGRSFDLFDWSADSIGAIFALLYAKIRFLN